MILRMQRHQTASLLCALLVFLAGCSDGKAASSAASTAVSGGGVETGFSRADELESALLAQDSSRPDSSAASAPSSAASGSGASSGRTPVSSAEGKGPGSASSASSEREPTVVTLTFPEGFTIAQIGARLEANHVCSKADFIKSAQTYDFTYYPLVKAIPADGKRAYKLEGYLFPDTYELYTNMKPQDVVGKFLRNAESRIDGKYSSGGMTTDQLVTLASIVEGEADNPEDMKKVSSVFHNRLKDGKRLEADATRTYCTQTLLAPNGPFSDDYKYYYNTYRCAALPAGPVCNPGEAALYAAANPASTDYYFFITANGKYYYQKTLEEHDAKLKELGMD